MNQDEPLKILIVGAGNRQHSPRATLMMASILERFPNAIFIRESADEHAERVKVAPIVGATFFDDFAPMPISVYNVGPNQGKGERKRNRAKRWR